MSIINHKRGNEMLCMYLTHKEILLQKQLKHKSNMRMCWNGQLESCHPCNVSIASHMAPAH